MHPCIAGGVGMNKKPVVNIGVQRFDKLRKQGSFYIDKTDFIREWWETGSEVTLITRPRRFGKTLNMSMLECFFFQENGLSCTRCHCDRWKGKPAQNNG